MNNYSENTKVEHLKFRDAINNFICDIKSEDSGDNLAEQLEILKLEVSNIFPFQTIQATMKKIRNNINMAQNYAEHMPDNFMNNLYNQP